MAMDFYSMYFWANKMLERQTKIKILKYERKKKRICVNVAQRDDICNKINWH